MKITFDDNDNSRATDAKPTHGRNDSTIKYRAGTYHLTRGRRMAR